MSITRDAIVLAAATETSVITAKKWLRGQNVWAKNRAAFERAAPHLGIAIPAPATSSAPQGVMANGDRRAVMAKEQER